MPNDESRIRPPTGGESGPIRHAPSAARDSSAFSLIEVMVAVTLMAFIVVALMAVFNSTQAAFKASVTQTDMLEGGRAAMELMTQDLRQMTPSDGVSNVVAGSPPSINGAVNFSVLANNNYYSYSPLVQGLPGSSVQRTNLLNSFFMLGRQNNRWIGIGYVVDNTNSITLYPLYRFYGETNIQSNPLALFGAFNSAVANAQWTNMSHVMDGVVHLTVHARDTNGVWISNVTRPYTNVQNTVFLSPFVGEAQFYMFSNTVPASVELELGVLEDRTLARAESLPNNVPAPPNDRRTVYLRDQAGKVHLFRQLVTIPNVDPTAYR